MHEVIDYSKNFVTGITKTVTKNKEDTPYVGVATIQVFDKNKELIQEVKSTNCITNAVLSKMYNDMFRINLLKNIRGPINEPGGGTFTPAYWMLLTNNSEPENVLEKSFKGQLVGFANGWAPYVGGSNLQGTVNVAETTSGDWNKHFVIDFPTNAGNGTFKSIYWCPDVNGLYGTYVCANTIIASGLSRENGCLCCNSDFAFNSYTNSDFKKINKINLSTKENTILDLGIFVRAICCNEANFFTLDDDKKVSKYTLEGVLVNSLFSIATSYAYNCTMLYVNSEIVIYDNSTKTISFYNITGTKTRSYITNLAQVICIYSDKDNEITLIVGNTNMSSYILNILTGELSFRRNFMVVSDESRNSIFYSVAKSGNNFYANLNTNLLKCTSCDYFSHTLLPEQITKTSANTMKIQYDFIVEPRGYFDV